jgi:hypothetical protein
MGKQFHFALLVLGEAHDQLYPGGSSLMDRGVYDAALSEVEYLARVRPAHAAPRSSAQMAPGEGLFSLRLPKFESYQPGI